MLNNKNKKKNTFFLIIIINISVMYTAENRLDEENDMKKGASPVIQVVDNTAYKVFDSKTLFLKIGGLAVGGLLIGGIINYANKKTIKDLFQDARTNFFKSNLCLGYNKVIFFGGLIQSVISCHDYPKGTCHFKQNLNTLDYSTIETEIQKHITSLTLKQDKLTKDSEYLNYTKKLQGRYKKSSEDTDKNIKEIQAKIEQVMKNLTDMKNFKNNIKLLLTSNFESKVQNNKDEYQAAWVEKVVTQIKAINTETENIEQKCQAVSVFTEGLCPIKLDALQKKIN